MVEKSGKKLRRAQLLELLVQLSEENDALKKENELLRSRLEDKTIAINNAGSIAEASLKLNKVFEAAQAAADNYLENVKNEQARLLSAVTNPQSTHQFLHFGPSQLTNEKNFDSSADSL